ncbi:MAG: hypothetical protein WC810_03075 [Janthinobacterium sp.]|jgi:hypothetical protein
MSNKNPSPATRFPVNRPYAPHTQKGPYFKTILDKLLSGKWEVTDPKVKGLLRGLELPETIGVIITLRRILNATEGDDTAIERIFDRVDGKVEQKISGEGFDSKLYAQIFAGLDEGKLRSVIDTCRTKLSKERSV